MVASVFVFLEFSAARNAIYEDKQCLLPLIPHRCTLNDTKVQVVRNIYCVQPGFA